MMQEIVPPNKQQQDCPFSLLKIALQSYEYLSRTGTLLLAHLIDSLIAATYLTASNI